MTFDILSKELYSLKQGSGENVAEFGVHLSQQVQILQSEYPRRILPEHVEEMKWDCFYEGLNYKYRGMLAHKVDGKDPAGYSNLFLAPRKLKRRIEARFPLPLKTAKTSVSKVTHSKTSGNLFPSHKLKANYIFTARAVTVGSNDVEESSGVKQEWDGETASADEEAKTSGGVEGSRSIYRVYHRLHQSVQTI